MEGFADPNLVSVTQQENAKTAAASAPAKTEQAAAGGSTSSSSGGTTAAGQEVTLEQEVKQLVGNVSSWWTDFSKRSQEQINAARKEIESQGGIVSIAKKEALKFEAQLNDAQKAARERATAAAEDGNGTKGETAGVSAKDGEGEGEDGKKGKSREAASSSAVEGDDGIAVDTLEEKARRKSRSDSRSEPQVTSTGEAIFDVDGDMTEEERQAIDQTIQAAKVNSQTALQNVQSFWDRLQADPRLSNIQASMAKTLKNVSLPKTATTTTTGTEGADGTKAAAPATLSFADVSKQFQASFPHLNWKDSQALAKKYYDASENVAKDWGKEMNALIGDLVKIVPPEEAEKAGETTTAASPLPSDTKKAVSGSSSAGAAPAAKGPIAASATSAATTEDEDFDWDGDMDSSAASTGLQPSSGPPTTNFEGAASPEETKKKDTKEAKKDEEDEDGDSDWE